MNPPHKIALKNVSIAIGPTIILKGINWAVKANEHWVITGNCGTGKTVLAEALGQKYRIASGTLDFPFLGDNGSYAARREAIRIVSFMDTFKLFRSVNTVHYYQQRFNAFDSDGFMTARDYLEDGGFDIDQHHRLLSAIGIDDLLHLERIKLSSGQTRKMMLAKAMLHRPKILVLDNPYIGLDRESRQILNDLLDSLVAQTDMTLILSGHHRSLPACISHRLHLHENGTMEKSTLGGLPSTVYSIKPNQKALKSMRAYFQNDNHHENFTDVINFENVNIRYNGKPILKNITWKVKQGEKWAVTGGNGSGKSTLLSLVYADNPQAYANVIHLFDQRRGHGESIWQIKQRIGFTSPELHAYFHENLSAQEVVLTGLTDTFVVSNNFEESSLDFMNSIFEYFEISNIANMKFARLSTGTQRLVLLIRALIKAPPVLLLDEPFQGMDAAMVFRCKYLIKNILNENHTLIFISHFKDELPDCIMHELVL